MKEIFRWGILLINQCNHPLFQKNVKVTDLNPLTQEFHAICVDKDAVPT